MTAPFLATPVGADVYSVREVAEALPHHGIAFDAIEWQLENDQRAHNAAQAVAFYYRKETGEPAVTAVEDLLSDLMHLVDALRTVDDDGRVVDFDTLLDRARNRYLEEIHGDQ